MDKIGIIGSGEVGRTLAAGFKKHGYPVRIGSRTPEKLADIAKSAGIETGTSAEVAAWSDVLVLAVKGAAAESALRLAGEANIKGKVVIDTTNPMSDAPPVDGVIQYFTGPNSSLMESLQKSFPAARLVKAFNSVGNHQMVNPSYAAGRPTMFFCGNDAQARAMVGAILETFGWEPLDLGTAVAARAIEPLAQLWCIPGFLKNQWTHAFKVLWS